MSTLGLSNTHSSPQAASMVTLQEGRKKAPSLVPEETEVQPSHV